jgi:tRNA wybutosine-synthesizing protein 1
MLKAAMQPIHAAISLEGEPTLYSKLGELVESFYDNGFKSVFIVTNGTQPRLLSNLGVEPSQLYVSVSAPDEATYNRVCKPLMPDGWRKLIETLDLMESFNCPIVLRHTLIPRLNMNHPSKYAKLAERAEATYLEAKAAKSVGYARKRFGYHEMAWHKDIRKFAEAIAAESGYEIIDEQPRSSVVLLSYLKKQKKLY